MKSIRQKIGAWQHLRKARRVLATKPVQPFDDGVLLFSMVGTANVIAYLVAIKSLHHHLQRGRVMLLDDGTLTDADRLLIAYHLGNPTIMQIQDVDTGECPKGNCWERLFAILRLRADDYVIQVDSDIIVLNNVDEVKQAIDGNRNFTLAGGHREAALGFLTAQELGEEMYRDGPFNDHIQAWSENAMKAFPDAGTLRYIRGCAGFSGFSRGASGIAQLTEFSNKQTKAIGARWNEWGSEQVASNFVIALQDDAMQLSYSRYVNHWTDPLPSDPALVHFIGTYRYDHGNYSRLSAKAIAAL